MPSRIELMRRRELLQDAVAHYQKHSKHEDTSVGEFLGWAEAQLERLSLEIDAATLAARGEPAAAPPRALN